jgi:hypothetical protein
MLLQVQRPVCASCRVRHACTIQQRIGDQKKHHRKTILEQDQFTMTATDDWITFADSHFMPHESIAACEGWPKGKQRHCETATAHSQILQQVRWALQK